MALLKQFFDAPKATEAEDTQHGAQHDGFYDDGTGTACDANEEKYPPRAGSEVVFRFNDDRMEKPDHQERKGSDGQAGKLDRHRFQFLLEVMARRPHAEGMRHASVAVS